MAGSIKDFEYTTDAGELYVVRMDESNGEAVGNADYGPLSTAQFYLPRNCVPRKARYTSADGNYTRSVIITDNAATVATLPASFAAADGNGGTVDVLLSQFDGERMSLIPKAADTGILDGDAT